MLLIIIVNYGNQTQILWLNDFIEISLILLDRAIEQLKATKDIWDEGIENVLISFAA